MNHINLGNTAGVFKGDNDNYYSTDLMLDFWSHREAVGQVLSQLTGGVNALISQVGVPVQGTGYTMNVPIQAGIVRFQVQVPQDYTSLPPTLINKDIFIQATSTAQTGLSLSSCASDGVTPNYIKLQYAETEAISRVKAHDSASWYSEVIPSFAIVIDTVAPTIYDLEIAKFTSNGATVTFTSYATVIQNLVTLYADIAAEAVLARNASNLSSGTVPDARFPATLPSLSGVNLTALNASNLASGTVPAARFVGGGLNSVLLGDSATANGAYGVMVGRGGAAGGQNSTAVGVAAGAQYYKSGAFGSGANSGGDNQIRIGDDTAIVHVYTSVVVDSDERIKEQIEQVPVGLIFIKKLNPVQYKLKDHIQELKDKDGNIIYKIEHKFHRKHFGLIAQDVKKIMDELNFDFAGYKDGSIDGGQDRLSLAYEEFIAPMIRAIQEQQEIIENQNKKIILLEERLSKLELK